MRGWLTICGQNLVVILLVLEAKSTMKTVKLPVVLTMYQWFKSISLQAMGSKLLFPLSVPQVTVPFVGHQNYVASFKWIRYDQTQWQRGTVHRMQWFLNNPSLGQYEIAWNCHQVCGGAIQVTIDSFGLYFTGLLPFPAVLDLCLQTGQLRKPIFWATQLCPLFWVVPNIIQNMQDLQPKFPKHIVKRSRKTTITSSTAYMKFPSNCVSLLVKIYTLGPSGPALLSCHRPGLFWNQGSMETNVPGQSFRVNPQQ